MANPNQKIAVSDLERDSAWAGNEYEWNMTASAIAVVLDTLTWRGRDSTNTPQSVEPQSKFGTVDALRLGDDKELHESPMTIEARAPFKRGAAGSETKSLVTVKMEDAEESVTMIERGYSEDLVRGWAAYQEAGIPLSNHLYVTDSGVLMDDVASGRRTLYSKSETERDQQGPTKDFSRRSFRETRRDRMFATTMMRSPQMVQANLLDYAAQATAYGIALPDDNAFGMVTGEVMLGRDGWELVALNYERAQTDVGNDPLLGQKNIAAALRSYEWFQDEARTVMQRLIR